SGNQPPPFKKPGESAETTSGVRAEPAASGCPGPSLGSTVDHVPPSDAPPSNPVTPLEETVSWHFPLELGAALKGAPAPTIPGYEIRGELGRGGMGVVYRARQIKADRIVALKLMLHTEHAGSSARARFDTEAQAVARLQHPNIVQVFEVGEADELPFFSLEFVAGGTLAQKIRRALLPSAEVARLTATLGRTMGYAHRSN